MSTGITSMFTNDTAYAFAPSGESSLSSGSWVVPPQPIPPNSSGTVAFQAQVPAGEMGLMGQAGYHVLSGGSPVGTLVLAFSDPYSGNSSASASTSVAGLSVSASIPESGHGATCTWTAST